VPLVKPPYKPQDRLQHEHRRDRHEQNDPPGPARIVIRNHPALMAFPNSRRSVEGSPVERFITKRCSATD